jgi:hypothetical protein
MVEMGVEQGSADLKLLELRKPGKNDMVTAIWNAKSLQRREFCQMTENLANAPTVEPASTRVALANPQLKRAQLAFTAVECFV